jgi:transposase-like protein
MGRKRTPIDAEELRGMMRRGLTVEEIAKHFGVAKSTAHSRVQAMKQGTGPRPVTPAAPASVPRVDEVPDVPPDDAPLELVNKWIAKVEAAAEAAESEGDLKTFATIAAKLVTLLEHRRKAAPPPVADPNEHPDMVEAAKRARKRLHDLIVTSPEEKHA